MHVMLCSVYIKPCKAIINSRTVSWQVSNIKYTAINCSHNLPKVCPEFIHFFKKAEVWPFYRPSAVCTNASHNKVYSYHFNFSALSVWRRSHGTHLSMFSSFHSTSCSGFFLLVANGRISSCFLWHIAFHHKQIHWFTDRQMGWFCILSVVNSAAFTSLTVSKQTLLLSSYGNGRRPWEDRHWNDSLFYQGRRGEAGKWWDRDVW